MTDRRPYRVTIRLGSPVALNHPWLHLDSLLLDLAHRRCLGRGIYDLPTFRPVTAPGIDRWSEAVYTRCELKFASVSVFHPEKLGSLDYYSRPDDGLPRNRIRIGVGHYRAWRLRWMYVAAETCTFWAWGQPDVARTLLEDLGAIGNDVRVGWGHVLSVTVEETDEDRSVIWEGRATRPIPVRLLETWSEAVPLAWKPPYWYQANVELCAPPGAEVDFGGSPRQVLRRHHGRPVA